MINRFATYLQNLGKQANFQIHQYSNTNPLKLNGTNASIPFISSREVLYDNNMKYTEKIIFNNGGGNFAVAIGYNPAIYTQTHIDKTNYLVANHLNNLKYDGYYLFNMFPDVLTKKIQKTLSGFPNYIEEVLKFLIQESVNCNFAIFIFWGSTVYLTNNVINALNYLQNYLHIFINTIGTASKHHKHPGRGVSLSTIASFPANLNPLVISSSHSLK